VEGFLDFSPEIIKSQLEEAGLTVTLDSFTLPDLELIRQNPSEFRSINISRVLDKEENIPLVLGAFQKISANADAVLAPACLGLGRMDYVSELSRKIGKPIKLISTLPPSLLGARFSTTLTKAFLARGGVLMPKDRAIGYELGPPGPRGAVISKLFTENHGDIPLRARYFILATGGFFSQGLTAEQNSVRESVFGLDLLETPGNRQEWTRESFFAPQPYVGFGVKTDATLRGFLAGEPFANLRCAGLVLGGFDTIRQGSGAGVALVTALAAAHAVLSEE
jgi:glycerol-3-phosphate dehydrogenase subunit B